MQVPSAESKKDVTEEKDTILDQDEDESKTSTQYQSRESTIVDHGTSLSSLLSNDDVSEKNGSKTSDEEIKEYFDKMFAAETEEVASVSLSSGMQRPLAVSVRESTPQSPGQDIKWKRNKDNSNMPKQSPMRTKGKRKSKSEKKVHHSPARKTRNAKKQPSSQKDISKLKSKNNTLKQTMKDLTKSLKSEVDKGGKKRSKRGKLQKREYEETKEQEAKSYTNGGGVIVDVRPPSEMTPEAWDQIQAHIRFLENEIDKVTNLCVQLSNASMEEEKEESMPAGDWEMAQKQIEYLENEFENVTNLCTHLTERADESRDTIEKLEREKELLEVLNSKLEEALNAARRGDGYVQENSEDRMCFACCCDWIPEPLVWFVSYLLRVD